MFGRQSAPEGPRVIIFEIHRDAKKTCIDPLGLAVQPNHHPTIGVIDPDGRFEFRAAQTIE